MDDLDAFLVRITEASLADIDDEAWRPLRQLTQSERASMRYLEGLRRRVQEARYLVAKALPEDRRARIHSRLDLSDYELDLIGRLTLWLDRYRAASEAFWSGLRHEFRHFEQLIMDRDAMMVYGRRYNRRTQPEQPGQLTTVEEHRLCSLFGLTDTPSADVGEGIRTGQF